MTNRLVLGSGSLVSTIVESLRDQHGTVDVGTDDEHLATSLREDGVPVTELDPADTDTLEGFDAEIVFVSSDARTESLAIARAARTAFPDAYLLVYTGKGTPEHGTEFEAVADKVIDPAREAASYVLDRVDDSSQRMRHLQRILRDIDRLAVVTHDNPDPDAIASGVALARLARGVGCEAEVCYYGNITHQENRAFVNVLDLELRNLGPDEDVSEFDGVALVDHSRPGVNDQLPVETPVDIVIDHHPPTAPVDARFVDLRSSVGATSTLLTGYLREFDVEIDEVVATALLFGIHVDTDAFSREVSPEDFEAAATLVSTANLGILERIESPSITAATFETIASAIRERRIEGQVLLSCVGRTSERDALAQAADRLLMLEGVTTTLVSGIKDDMIFISARSRGDDIDLGETLRDAFGQIGSAGGHVDMAGAQIHLGVLETVDDEESLPGIVEEIVTDRFLDAIDARTSQTVTGVYAPIVGEDGYQPAGLTAPDGETSSDTPDGETSSDTPDETRDETSE